MTLKSLMEALKTDVSVALRESDNTPIAEFNRNSYKAISDSYLKSEIDDVEITVKSAVTLVITLKEKTEEPASPGGTTGTDTPETPKE